MIVDTSNLVTTNMIAERLYVKSCTVSNWKARYHDFPKPVLEFGPSKLYYYPQVEDWYNRFRGMQ